MLFVVGADDARIRFPERIWMELEELCGDGWETSFAGSTSRTAADAASVIVDGAFLCGVGEAIHLLS